MPKVSVITAVLPSASQHIAEAWDSLKAQDLPAGWTLEWIIHVDGPGRLTNDFTVDDGRVELHQSTTREGPAIARTLALGRATGDLVKVLDADDILTLGQLAREIEVFERFPAVVWSTSRVLDLLSDGSTVGFPEDPPPGVIEQDSVISHWRTHHHRASVHPATLCMRADELRSLGGWMALPASEDTALLLVLNALYQGYFLSEPGLMYRKWDQQMTAQDRFKSSAEQAIRYSVIEDRLDSIARLNGGLAAPRRPVPRPMPAPTSAAFLRDVLNDNPNTLPDLLSRIFRWLNVGLVLDVGGHVGEFTELLRAEVGYKSSVISFEPDPISYRILAEAASSDESWSTIELALGTGNGTSYLHRFDRSNLNSLRPPNEHLFELLETVEVETTAVAVRRLDNWLPDYFESWDVDRRIFLKIDAQGSDIEVVRGAEGILEFVVAIQLEVSVRPIYDGAEPWLDVISEMESLGYAVAGMFPITRDSGLLSIAEFDVVFVRNNLSN